MDSASRRSFHIGRYHCVEALAQGPLGETFRAKVYGVAGLEKQYALTQIDASLRVDPAVRARVLEAARLYATLEHARVARLVEINDEGESLFLVVELARGIDLPRLSAHLRGRGEAMPVDQAILIAADIAEALEIAQRPTEAAPGGVPHLGLHPAAIAVLGEGEVRVSDFAIGGALDRPGWADDDAMVSLMAYLAPERARGDGPSPLGDLWSVGALLYELCTGTALLGGATAAELTARRAAPTSWERLPARPGLRELLERLLADDPASRPESPSALRTALVDLLGLELPRARGGLQALAKRALGRALTRTGSFAAIAIPSSSFSMLADPAPAQPASPPPSTPFGPRTILGIATTPRPLSEPPSASPARAWSPPRKTGSIPIVLPSESDEGGSRTTLQGLGARPNTASEPDLPLMEMAELPPSGMGDITVTERSIDAVSFDDGVTSPHGRLSAEDRAEQRIDALEPESLRLDPQEAATNPGPPAPAPVDDITLKTERVMSAHLATRPTDPRELSTSSVSNLPTMMGVSALPRPVLHTPTGTQPLMTPSGAPALEPPSEPATRPTMLASAVEAPPAPSAQLQATAAPMPVAEPPAPSSPMPAPITAPTMGVATRPLPTTEMVDAAASLPAKEPARPTTQQPAQQSARRPGIWIAGVIIGTAIAAALVIFGEHGPTAVVTTPPPAEVHEPSTTPKVEAKTEAPKVEAPKAEAPKVETAKIEAPKVETPKVEAPKVEAKVEAPKAEAPLAPMAGQLAVQSTPAGAALWVDGELRGTTPLSTPMTAGKHRATLVLQGMKLAQKSYAIEAGATGDTWVAALEPAKLPADVAGEGGLKMRCHTQGELRILVDGHDTGFSCPNDQRISVAPGDHKIGLYSPRTGETKELDGAVEDDADHSTRIYVKY